MLLTVVVLGQLVYQAWYVKFSDKSEILLSTKMFVLPSWQENKLCRYILKMNTISDSTLESNMSTIPLHCSTILFFHDI